MGITISGNNGTAVNASTDGSLKVSQTMDDTNAGFVTAQGEVHSGDAGQPRFVRPIDVSPDYRLRVGNDSIFWQDTFAQALLNLSKYKATESTHTKAITAGRLVFNSGSSVAAGSSVVSTWRTFPVYGSYPTYFEAWALFATAGQANCVCEMGLGIAAAASAPTDGVMFRLDAAGVWQGVINEGGSETQTNLGFTHAINTIYHFLIVVHNDRTEFWIDDILYGVQLTPTSYGSPCISNSLPLLMRQYHTGATGAAQQMQITQINITLGDLNSTRLWATMQAGMGNSCVNKSDGAAAGQTSNFALSSAPTLITVAASSMANAAYYALGGQYQINVNNAAETDCKVFSFQVPTASTVQPGKCLMLRGVHLDSIVTGAAPSTVTILQWGMALGHTAESLATVDSSSAGTRGPRRFTLGMTAFTTAAVPGTISNPPYLDLNLDAPICVEPGCYCDLLVKFVASSTGAAPVFRGTAFYNGYWE
jgi:hypothetical protein